MGNLTIKACNESKPKDRPFKLYDGGGLFLQVLQAASNHGSCGKRRTAPRHKRGSAAFPP